MADESERKYWAFISYSSADKRVAKWLRRRLESYLIPADYRPQGDKELPQYLRPVFRDRDELSGASNLGPALKEALEQSRFLVVLCSPNSARSKWVDMEIEDFRKLHGADRVLALILDGEPNASSNDALDDGLESFPPALRYPHEPLAGDLRKEADGKERGFLKVFSGITGIPFDALYRRHERAQRRKRIIWSTAGLSLIVVLSGLTISSIIGFKRAKEQEAIAIAAANAERKALIKSETARKAADQVINTMIYDLRDELEEVGMTPLLERVMKTARDYWETFPPEEELISSREREKASTLNSSAGNLIRLGRSEEAIALVSEAVQIDRARLLEEPSSNDRLKSLIFALNNQGDILRQTKGYPAALDSFTEAENLSRQLVEREASDEHLRVLAVSLQWVANAKFDLEGVYASYDLYKEYFELQKSLYLKLNTEQARRSFSIACQKLGRIELKLGHLPRALAAFRVNLELVSNKPIEEQSRSELDASAIAHQWLAVCHDQAGDIPEASEHYGDFLDLTTKLVTEVDTMENQLALSRAHAQYGDFLMRLSKFEEASHQFEQNLKLAERVDAEFSSKSTRQNLAVAYQWISEFADRMDDMEKALEFARKSLKTSQETYAGQENTEAQKSLAVAHQKLGRLLLKQGKLSDAKSHIEKQSELTLQVSLKSGAIEDEHTYAAALELSADYHEQTEQVEEAVRLMKLANQTFEQLQRRVDTPERRLALLRSLRNSAMLHLRLKRLQEAESLTRRQLVVIDQNIAASPSRQNWIDRAFSLSALADVLMQRDQPDKAIKVFQQAATLNDRWIGENPSVEELKQKLGPHFLLHLLLNERGEAFSGEVRKHTAAAISVLKELQRRQAIDDQTKEILNYLEAFQEQN